jgi:hypothetical protein
MKPDDKRKRGEDNSGASMAMVGQKGSSPSDHDSMSTPKARLRVMWDALKQYLSTPGAREAPRVLRSRHRSRCGGRRVSTRFVLKAGRLET